MSLEAAIQEIRCRRPRKVVAFTGAGVSADSGVPIFRGPSGLWRNFRAEDLATPEAFAGDPAFVWEWYEWRRALIREARPNAAHEAIAAVPDAVVVTQNVDGLHARAGSKDIVELHGNIFRVRCTREGTASMQPEPFAKMPPRCDCGALLRPDVVWFGEMLPEEALARASSAIIGCDLLLVIGTSGVVYPAAGLVSLHRGLSIEVNPEPSSMCTYAIAGRAAAVVPEIVRGIRDQGSGGLMSLDEFRVWHRCIALVKEIYTISEAFPRREIFGLTSQMRRAAVSAPSNIAEGHERKGTGDYVRFISIAQGSLAEIRTHIIIATELGFVHRDAVADVLQEIGEIARSLNTTRQSLIPDP